MKLFRLKRTENKITDICILYATTSGNAKNIAQEAQKYYMSQGEQVTLSSTRKISAHKLTQYKNLIMVISTDGEGDPPSMASRFFKDINSTDMPSLAKLHYSVCALGDSSYENFCQAGKEIDKKLTQLGAKAFYPRVDCDTDFAQAAAQWIKEGFVSLKGKQLHNVNLNIQTNEVDQAIVKRKKKLTKGNTEKPCYQIKLQPLNDASHILPGDSIGIRPKNPINLVNELCNLLDLRINDTYYQFILFKAEITTLSKQTIFRYFDLAPNKKLEDLINNSKALDEFISYANILDLLNNYPIKVKNEELLRIIPTMKERIYSVASDYHYAEGTIDLTVKTIRYNFMNRLHEGAGSTHLTKVVEENSELTFKHYPNLEFRLNTDEYPPLILIGIGTGIAPFRAFWQHYKRHNQFNKIWLIWGDKHSNTDYIYEEEINKMKDLRVIKQVDIVFSRDKEKKSYVQNVLKIKEKDIIQWLKHNAHIYTCGSLAMAKDVESELKNLFHENNSIHHTFEDIKNKGRYHVDAY